MLCPLQKPFCREMGLSTRKEAFVKDFLKNFLKTLVSAMGRYETGRVGSEFGLRNGSIIIVLFTLFT